MSADYESGRYLHIIKRGARGMNIVRDDADRWRFLRLLRYLNDKNSPRNWERDVTNDHIRSGFARPDGWSEPDPYVSVVAYCLMDNHFHLLVLEHEQGDVSKFMQRLCTSMSLYYNAKYQERGTLFQSAYKARAVENDDHLQYLAAYIQIKNPFERYPGGLRKAAHNFERAIQWVENDPFTSFGHYVGSRQSALVDIDLVRSIMRDPEEFLGFARDVVLERVERDEYLDRLMLD